MSIKDEVFNAITDIDTLNRNLLKLQQYTNRYFVDQDRLNDGYCIKDKFRSESSSNTVINNLSEVAAEKLCTFYEKRWQRRVQRTMISLVLLGEVL